MKKLLLAGAVALSVVSSAYADGESLPPFPPPGPILIPQAPIAVYPQPPCRHRLGLGTDKGRCL
jgi:hypothetical protein